MEDTRISVSDPRFFGETDSETIQNAINYAHENGYKEVVIPCRNARTDSDRYVIPKVILLPSNMTVYLDSAHMVMADGVWENMFRNENAYTELGKTLAGEQENIRIIGLGHAVIDGGTPNGLCEQLHRDDPEHYPSMYVNLMIFFCNVRHFEVRNIQFLDTRYWAMNFMFCRWGKLIDLDFRNYATMENQDGIDIRVGCEYITVENITGITGDDTIALTALPLGARHLAVEGKKVHIHDINIRNVESSTHGCALLRFLCEDGAQIYNVNVDGLKDTGVSVGGAAIFMGTGSTRFARDHARVMGDFRNITIRNIMVATQRGIDFNEPTENVTIENLTTFGRNEVGLAFGKNFVAKNVKIRNVNICPDPESHEDAARYAFSVPEENPEAFEGLYLSDVTVTGEKYIFAGLDLPIENFRYEAPTEGYMIPFAEKPKLKSGYGRYFYGSYGKPIENRPRDNRFGGGLSVEDEKR